MKIKVPGFGKYQLNNLGESNSMDWTQFIIFAVSVFGMFIWNRAESRADQRNTDAKIESIRTLMHALIEENKDFHGRLCSIEERVKK